MYVAGSLECSVPSSSPSSTLADGLVLTTDVLLQSGLQLGHMRHTVWEKEEEGGGKKRRRRYGI